MAHLVVVGTDEGGVLMGVGLTLEDDDGDAFVVGTVDGGTDGGELVGGNDQEVDAAADEVVDLLYLALGVVEGGGKAQLDALVEVGLHLHL